MAQLFPAWSDTALRLALLAISGGAIAIVVGPMIFVRTPYHTGQRYPVDQPVQFDHRHHVADDGIDCRYCHDLVERSATAGIPSTEVCGGCHAQIWSRSPMLEVVRRSWFSGMPIPWNRVHQLPDFVYFDHAIHIARGIGCVSCHGRVDQMALVEQVAPLSMRWCLDCHRAPEPRLRPRDAITSTTWRPPAGAAGEVLARALVAEYQPRHLDSCTNCHR
jgi:hypothetical protein